MTRAPTEHGISAERAFRTWVPAPLRSRLVKSAYDLIARHDVDGEVTFLNFGYAPATVAVDDALARPKAQLYEEVVRGVSLTGLDVLEVSSGRGGGAAYLVEHHRPCSLVGIDLCERAVELCRARHRRPGLSFRCGDAEALPFDAGCFDAVVNVEAAMNYGSIERFAAEVHRVLRPGGHLLFADQCAPSDLDALRTGLTRSGLELVAAREIGAHVAAALETVSAGTAALIERRVPRALRPLVREFAGVRGSIVHRRLARGALQYWILTLRRP